MNNYNNSQASPYISAPGSALDLDVSVLTDRDGPATPLMDKSGIRIFDPEAEAQIQRYVQVEQDRLHFYKEEAFAGEAGQENAQLDRIKGQVFASAMVQNRSLAHKDPETVGRGGIAWFIILLVLCLSIPLAYGRFKKKERERRIADIDDCYDE